jgi:hypothetical protein
MRPPRLATSCLVFASMLAGAPALGKGPASAEYARGTKGLFWFLHVSDSHIGAGILGPDALPHLQRALGEVVGVVQPVFVVNTGDLQNGSLNGVLYAGQDPDDWAAYEQAYTEAGMTPAFYFDLPGNHDGYGDIGLSWYLGHSMQGKSTGQLHSSWTHTTALGGEYVFFGLNSAGVGQPALHPEEPAFTSDELGFLMHGLQQHADTELAFVFAHHPLDDTPGGAQIAAILAGFGGGFYLHGHKHTLQEYMTSVPTVVANEVASLGENDTDDIGVGVVDHNAFVYGATSITAPWPMVVITAPVHRNLRDSVVPNPWAYSVCKDRTDNPVRALVFALDAPSAVTVTVGGLAPVAMAPAPGVSSLWQAAVDTRSLTAGPKALTVTATVDGVDAVKTITVPFDSGPCTALPDDDDHPDGGAGGAGAGGGAAGASPTGGGGGGGAAGAPGATPGPGEDGGCGCRAAGRASGGAVLGLGWLWLLGLARRARPWVAGPRRS